MTEKECVCFFGIRTPLLIGIRILPGEGQSVWTGESLMNTGRKYRENAPEPVLYNINGSEKTKKTRPQRAGRKIPDIGSK